MTIKDLKYVKTIGVNSLNLIFHKVNKYFEEINRNKYLTLVPTNKTKKNKKYKELCIKIRDLIMSIIKAQLIIMKNI